MLGEHQGLTTRVPHRAPSCSASGPTQSSTESRLDLPVPQAVDDRVAHGRGHRVGDRQHLVQVHGFHAAGAAVDEEGCRVEDAHHHQVGGAGGEGLAPGGGRRHVEHRHPDGRVGGQGDQQRPAEDDDGREEVHQLGQGHVGARQVEQGRRHRRSG